MDPELKAYLDQNFSAIDRRFQETGQQIQQVQLDLGTFREETAQSFAQVDERLDKLETDVRGAYVAIEGLHGEIRLVADGVANVSERLERHEEKVSRDLAEIKSFNRLSYKDLDNRVRKLEAAG